MTALERHPLAVVTGGSRGLGATIARFLAGEGYDLVLDARDARPLDRMVDELSPLGVDVRGVSGDVTDAGHRDRLADAVAARGRLDLLVNNASELGPSPLRALVDWPLDDLDRVWRTNVVAPIALVRSMLPYLVQGRGRVVNISSDAALGGYAGWGGYGATKAALDLVSITLANELKDRGISVVSVDPGDLRTAMHQAAFLGEDISDRPLPEVTVPFWAWLFHQDPARISGHRFRAQSERWEVPA